MFSTFSRLTYGPSFIQESHLSNEEHQKLKRDWVGQIFYSSFTSRSRGVAILINKALPLTEVKVKSDKLGRYVMISGMLYGDNVSYLNVYAPPVCPPDFHTKVFSLFSDWITESSVIAGDFNCCLNPRLDKSHSGSRSSVGTSQTLLGCCRDLDLIDTWRALHPTDKQYSFYSKVHKSPSRIHYFFTPNHALQKVISCSIGNIVISDHSPLFLVMSCKEQRPLPQWRFKNYLLKNPDFIEYFTEQLKFFLAENDTPEVSPSVLWETAKAVSRGFTTSFSAHLKHKKEAMPLTLHTPSTSSSAVPFRWSPSGFVYLGIHITLSLSGLYKANFIPLIRKIKEDL
uniref:Endonuclease/exonuclease/phosphatase domain-containing protein n=1 Tax=Amphiprion ocellaris TaxID=80972 RepID=A0AAQ6ACP2_AMPOC